MQIQLHVIETASLQGWWAEAHPTDFGPRQVRPNALPIGIRNGKHARLAAEYARVIPVARAASFQPAKRFFSEEKKQKTFTSPPVPTCRPWPERPYSLEIKVFWFFSPEKNIFLAILARK